jgi:hypothetical protein
VYFYAALPKGHVGSIRNCSQTSVSYPFSGIPSGEAIGIIFRMWVLALGD